MFPLFSCFCLNHPSFCTGAAKTGPYEMFIIIYLVSRRIWWKIGEKLEPAVPQATQLREDLMFSYQKSSPGRQQPKAVRFTTTDVVKDREQNQPRTVAIWLGCTYKSRVSNSTFNLAKQHLKNSPFTEAQNINAVKSKNCISLCFMTDRCSLSFQFKKPERIIKRRTKRKQQKNLQKKIYREVPVCLAWVKTLLNYKPPLFIFGTSERLLFNIPKTSSFKPFLIFFFHIKTNQPVDEKVPLSYTSSI